MSTESSHEGIFSFPSSIKTELLEVNGTQIFVRWGGSGTAVLLLHGFGDTGDMWGELAARLVSDHTIIAPDLRGMGKSAKPDNGYDKKTQALDIAGLLDSLRVESADLVTHDIGNMVGYAFAAQFPQRVTRWIAMEAPLPGIGPWEKILQRPAMWHFGFGGPDMERLVAGRERVYLDRFWNDFSKNPASWDEAKREHYATLYAQPGAMHASFAQFAAFGQDAIDNNSFLTQGKLQMPVLAVGGESASGNMVGAVIRFVADKVEDAVIPNCGHWLMEEQGATTTKLVKSFLSKKS